MVTHPLANIGKAHLAVGDDVEGERFFGSVPLDQLGVLVHSLIEVAEEAPHTGFASTQTAEVIGIVGLLEVKVFVLTLEPAVLASHVDDILLVHTVLLVTEGDLVDACLVSVGCNSFVRDADSYPSSSLFLRALTY